ncbi:hypothetical protein [Streptomyces sp. NRRL B-1347]|uniref:hypothetical protein n=1 Tax=Streptomyces sp. NRRL B-1347 TaxID=1476877 RepID=UPI0004C9ACA3|nr:hypothetical protein [Streptomyces sp. NRRL B-1347]
MGGRGAVGVIAAVIGAVGVIVAAFITVWGQDDGSNQQKPGTIVQTNEQGDNLACIGQHVACGPGAASSTPGTDRPAPQGSSGR